MTPQEIRNEITADPAILALVPNTVALAEALSEGRTLLGSVGRADFAGWAAASGMRSKIQDFSTTTGHPLRDSSLAILDVLQGAAETIDFAMPQNMAILNAWFGLEHLSEEHHSALVAMATKSVAISEYSVRVAIFNDDGSLRV